MIIDPQFDLGTIEHELVVTITIAFAAMFALVAGFLNKKIGRRKTIIVSSFFFALGSAVLGAANGYIALLVGRAIVGAGLGIASMSIPMYLSECAPSELRGKVYYNINVNNNNNV